MLSTANHLKQVKKIKIKEDQLVGLRESYDVSFIKGALNLADRRSTVDRPVAAERSVRQVMSLWKANTGGSLYLRGIKCAICLNSTSEVLSAKSFHKIRCDRICGFCWQRPTASNSRVTA